MSLRDVIRKLGLGSRPDQLGGIIHQAAKMGDLAEVGAQIRKGVDPSLADSHGDTPLHWAAFEGHGRVASLLIGAKADLNAVGDHGLTPLHVAAARGKEDLTRILLEAGADVHSICEKGRTPLDWAKERREWKVGELIVAYLRRDQEPQGLEEDEF